MSVYNPDVWIVVNLTGSEVKELDVRILAGWYGGYGGSDSWKLSSGVVKIVDERTHWEFHNQSGSVYRCRKEAERFSGYTSGIFNSFAKSNTPELALEHVDFDSIKDKFQIQTQD